MQPSVWLSLDIGKGNFFFFHLLTLSQECELVFCSQNKQAGRWWDISHPTTKGWGLFEQMASAWPLDPACTAYLINSKDSPTNRGPLSPHSHPTCSPSYYEFGCGQSSSKWKTKIMGLYDEWFQGLHLHAEPWGAGTHPVYCRWNTNPAGSEQ